MDTLFNTFSNGDQIDMAPICDQIKKAGFDEQNPKLIDFFTELKQTKQQHLNKDEFMHLSSKSAYMLSRVFSKQLVIPEFEKFNTVHIKVLRSI